MVVRWTLYDPVEVETYTMQINPKEGGSPDRNKNVGYKNTADGGKTIVYEGRDDPKQFEWSGTILTQQHLEDLDAWFAKRRQVQLTDDLGRQYWVYITNFSPKRERAHMHPWKHSYTMKAIEVNWP